MPGSVAQRRIPLLAKYIRAASTVGVAPCCVSWTPLLPILAVRSQAIAVGAELNLRLRNAGIPDVVVKGPSIARYYASRDETPFADIDLNVRPAALSVCGPSRTVLQNSVSG